MKTRIIYKDIKNIYLRINNGELIISSPKGISEEYLLEISKKHYDKLKSKSLYKRKISLDFSDKIILNEIEYTVIKSNNTLIDKNNKLVYLNEKNLVSSFENILKESALELLRDVKMRYNISFEYNNVRIKNNKTNWGSVSNKNNLNLNIRLPLLSLKLSEYIIIHELCHLKHLNHSKGYWQLVETFIKDYKSIRKELKLLKIG
jgi:predicted metal-dependent hydrolase